MTTEFSDGLTNSTLVDITATTPRLYKYVLVSVSGGNVALTGYFIDFYGNQLENMLSGNVTGTAQTLSEIFGVAIPANAIGFVGGLQAAIWFGLTGLSAGTVGGETPKAGYPQFQASTYFALGRV